MAEEFFTANESSFVATICNKGQGSKDWWILPQSQIRGDFVPSFQTTESMNRDWDKRQKIVSNPDISQLQGDRYYLLKEVGPFSITSVNRIVSGGISNPALIDEWKNADGKTPKECGLVQSHNPMTPTSSVSFPSLPLQDSETFRIASLIRGGGFVWADLYPETTPPTKNCQWVVVAGEINGVPIDPKPYPNYTEITKVLVGHSLSYSDAIDSTGVPLSEKIAKKTKVMVNPPAPRPIQVVDTYRISGRTWWADLKYDLSQELWSIVQGEKNGMKLDVSSPPASWHDLTTHVAGRPLSYKAAKDLNGNPPQKPTRKKRTARPISPSASRHGMTTGRGGKGWFIKLMGEYDERLNEKTLEFHGVQVRRDHSNNAASADIYLGASPVFSAIFPNGGGHIDTHKGDASVRFQIALYRISTTEAEFHVDHPIFQYHKVMAVRNLDSYPMTDQLMDWLKGKLVWDEGTKKIRTSSPDEIEQRRSENIMFFLNHYVAKKGFCDTISFADASTQSILYFALSDVFRLLTNPKLVYVASAPAEAISITFPDSPTSTQRQVLFKIEVRHDSTKKGAHVEELKVSLEGCVLRILKAFGVPFVSLDYSKVKVAIPRSDFDRITSHNSKQKTKDQRDLSHLISS